MSIFSLKGKVALITGAASGIGKGIATQLALAGADVMLNDNALKKLKETAKEINEFSSGTVDIVSADFFDERGRYQILADTIKVFAQVDILVCNPYKSIQKPAIEWSDGNFGAILCSNLVSYFSMARIFAEHNLKEGRDGLIIFITSEFGTMDMVRCNSLGYDVAKAGIIRMISILAKEWMPKIRVNGIAPGATNTPGERRFATERKLQNAWKKLPKGRPCSPDEIGMEAVSMAANPMINGEVRRINSGEHLT